jgi:peptidoglycan/xylan/chitin deacetylase (PgdA/CDA1 family)
MSSDKFRRVVLGRNGLVFRVLLLSISAVFYGQSLLRRSFRRLVGLPLPATCIVLYYHSVPARFRTAFAKQLEMVGRLTRPVNAAGGVELVPGVRHAAITFDDAFEDAVVNAVPELVKQHVPGVFFVTTGFLGKAASWWPASTQERDRRIASLEQLRALPEKWISLGAHTITHPHLPELAEADAKNEIVAPRHNLEVLLGRKVETFSFPYGDFNESLVSWCHEAGYKRVFTSQHRLAFRSAEEFVTGRVKAEPADWPLEFRLKLLGGYLWMPLASALKRKILAPPLVRHLRSLGVLPSRRSAATTG